MLQPKRTKYRKAFRGKVRGKATRGITIAFGDYALAATEHGLFSARQIEATRKVLARSTKRTGRMWIRIFPDHPVTQKAQGVKMGSGKGDIKEYVAKIQNGRILFELKGVTEEMAREAFRKAAHKIPMKTKFIKREGFISQEIEMHEEIVEEETTTSVEDVEVVTAKPESDEAENNESKE